MKRFLWLGALAMLAACQNDKDVMLSELVQAKAFCANAGYAAGSPEMLNCTQQMYQSMEQDRQSRKLMAASIMMGYGQQQAAQAQYQPPQTYQTQPQGLQTYSFGGKTTSCTTIGTYTHCN